MIIQRNHSRFLAGKTAKMMATSPACCQCQRHYSAKSKQDSGLASLKSHGSPEFMVEKEEREFFAPGIIFPANRNIYYWPITNFHDRIYFNSSAVIVVGKGKESFSAPGISFSANRNIHILFDQYQNPMSVSTLTALQWSWKGREQEFMGHNPSN